MAREIIFPSSPPPALAGGSLMILAAGFGTRLRPLTEHLPKALVPVAGQPLLGLWLERLRPLKPAALLVNGHYRVEQLEAFLATSAAGFREVRLLREAPILDTGGGLRRAMAFARGRFLATVNVDVVSDLSPALALDRYRREKALVTMILHDHPRYNQVEVDDGGRITAFGLSRPRPGRRLLAYTGIQVCSPRLFRLLQRCPEPVFPLVPFYQRLLDSGRRDLLARVMDGDENYYWRDVGTPGDLEALENDLAARPELARRLGFPARGQV